MSVHDQIGSDSVSWQIPPQDKLKDAHPNEFNPTDTELVECCQLDTNQHIFLVMLLLSNYAVVGK